MLIIYNQQHKLIKKKHLGPRDSLIPKQRRRLGRSPSPLPIRTMETSRATNTPTPEEKIYKRDSKSTLREALSRLQRTYPFFIRNKK